jgi:hypothetical protein
VTLGRYVTSTGEEDFAAQRGRSLSQPNLGPMVGPVVINEIHYHPEAGGDEFIELRNITGQPVPLQDPQLPTNLWRIDGLGFVFPSGLTLAPNGLLLVVPISPELFRSRYGIPPAVPIVGPYVGELQDSGENLELQKPASPDLEGVVGYVVVDRVRYNDKAPWPPAADGSGPSLQRRDSASYGNDPINWDSALPSPGRLFSGGIVPTIVQGPAPVTVVATREATFSVVATGPGPLFYQWRHEGTSLSGATNTSLVLTNLQLAQAGRYSVLVFNENGTVESPAALLEILVAPTIFAQPAGTNIFVPPDVRAAAVNRNVTFSIGATSSTSLRYQWRWNGAPLAGATNTSLVVSNVTLAQEGVYSVALTDANGTVFSAPAYLQPLITPFILQPPLSQTAVTSAAVTVSVVIGGYPAPFGYIYRSNSVSIGYIISSERTNFFTFNAPGIVGTVLHRVIVTNLALSTFSTNASFTVTSQADADGDGLPDGWETQFGLDPSNRLDRLADADGDGSSNAEEYRAGTDPNDPASVLRLEIGSGIAGAVVHLDAVSNRTYSVEFTDGLRDSTWQKLLDLPARATNWTESVPDPGATTNRFYRVLTPRRL